MTSKKQSKESKFRWSEVISAVTSVAALFISLLALRQSDVSQRISEESNNIARTAHASNMAQMASNMTQAARGLRADLRYVLLVARSPNLRADEDKDSYQPSELKPLLITTPFQREALKNYDANLNKGYIFVIFVNYGPSDAERLQFTNFRWEPRKGVNKPVGIDIEGIWGPIPHKYLYAALIDILEPIDKQKGWNKANFDLDLTNYSFVLIEALYQDGLNDDNPIRAVFGDTAQLMPPVEVTPTRKLP